MKYFRLVMLTSVLYSIFSSCNPKTQGADLPTGDSSSATLDSPVIDNNSTDTGNVMPKTDTAVTGITERHWNLIELMGKPIAPPPAGTRRIHIRLRDSGSLEGFGGCNGLGGNYELKAGDRITIGSIIRTQIACPDLETENELVRLLEAADSYTFSGNTLVLNKQRMAPLARFEASDAP